MPLISAVIITFNEEENIGRCIDSLQEVVDEVLVIDSYSTDKTEAICRIKNVKFISHVFEGHIQQKNFAMEQAIHDYVLSLDADECLGDQLRSSILQIKTLLDFDAYAMNRLNNFCGKWMRHSGWYPDKKIRLWNRLKGKWGGINPHDKIVMNEGASIHSLKGDLLHYTVASIQQFRDQQQRFAKLASIEIFKLGKTVHPIVAVIKAAAMFVRRYFLQSGFLDGYYGWIICSEAARYTYAKYKMAYQLKKNSGVV